jgi:predicted small lipoprotein YifL
MRTIIPTGLVALLITLAGCGGADRGSTFRGP